MANEFKGARAYLTIPVGITRDKDLLKKPKTILLMGEIITMLNITGSFYMSNTQIAKRLDVSKRTVTDYLKILEDKKLISKKPIKDPHNNSIILGRKITAGAYLGKYTSIGWGNASPYPMETDCEGVGKPTSYKEYQYNKASNKASNKDNEQSSLTVSQLQDEFKKLWARYPNKKGKKDAFNHYKAWRKASPSKHTVEYISKKLDAYLSYIRQKNVKPQYIMHGSTWFNGRFDDELKVDDVGDEPNGGFDPRMMANLDDPFQGKQGSDPGAPDSSDFPF